MVGLCGKIYQFKLLEIINEFEEERKASLTRTSSEQSLKKYKKYIKALSALGSSTIKDLVIFDKSAYPFMMAYNSNEIALFLWNPKLACFIPVKVLHSTIQKTYDFFTPIVPPDSNVPRICVRILQDTASKNLKLVYIDFEENKLNDIYFEKKRPAELKILEGHHTLIQVNK